MSVSNHDIIFRNSKHWILLWNNLRKLKSRLQALPQTRACSDKARTTDRIHLRAHTRSKFRLQTKPPILSALLQMPLHKTEAPSQPPNLSPFLRQVLLPLLEATSAVRLALLKRCSAEPSRKDPRREWACHLHQIKSLHIENYPPQVSTKTWMELQRIWTHSGSNGECVMMAASIASKCDIYSIHRI